MDNDNPMLILTLIAKSPMAGRLWNDEINRERYNYMTDENRELTAAEREATPSDIGVREDQLQLAFDKRPKSLKSGFVFGRDPMFCDVILDDNDISSRSFRIALEEDGHIILQNLSRTPARVKYENQPSHPRRVYTWILFPQAEKIQFVAGIHDQLHFEIKFPDHSRCRSQYEKFYDEYIKDSNNEIPSLGALQIESLQSTRQTTPSRNIGTGALYYTDLELGKGGFGTVYRALDVRSGQAFALKTFTNGNISWKNEVGALEYLSHPHIVQFHELIEEFGRRNYRLVMEYLPSGNLRCQLKFAVFEQGEIISILFQCLEALEYLHAMQVTHRDVKPENILFSSRYPIHIRLADFGLARVTSPQEMASFVGTYEYMAPEVVWHHLYTQTVDVWSLGIVIMELVFGLPYSPDSQPGADWIKQLFSWVEGLPETDDMTNVEEELLGLLAGKMIRTEEQDRASARDCIAYANYRNLDQAQSTVTPSRWLEENGYGLNLYSPYARNDTDFASMVASKEGSPKTIRGSEGGIKTPTPADAMSPVAKGKLPMAPKNKGFQKGQNKVQKGPTTRSQKGPTTRSQADLTTRSRNGPTTRSQTGRGGKTK